MGRIIDRRRVMGGKDVLPYGAVPIEYLESSGTQYIDTGLVHQIQNYEYFIDFTPCQNDNESVVFGSSNSYVWDGQSWDNTLYIGNTGSTGNGFNRVAYIRQTTRLVVVNNHVTVYKDGNITSDFDFSGSIISRRHILLYAYTFNSDNASAKSSQRVYSFSIIMNGVKVLEFIPVRVGYTGYMYDKVSGQLFGNAGTGNFILGPDKDSTVIITQEQQHEMYGE